MVPLPQGFEKISILLIYRSNSFNAQDFKGRITHLIIFNKPDYVLDDFNNNALRNLPLLEVTKQQYGYTLLGTEPAHIMGGYWIMYILEISKRFLRR